MKKFINKPENFIDEMLEGLYLAFPEQVCCVDGDLRALVRTERVPGKVGIATGGGSGHLPLFLGYVGAGMLDGCSVGDVFQSSGADQMLAVTRAVDSGAGVLYIYGNYNGDKLNFRLAAEMAEFEHDIRVTHVIGRDDVSADDPAVRRGVAGIFFVYKCAGAAADERMDLDQVTAIAQHAADNVRSMGVGLSPCIVPRVGHPSFTLGEGEMELGMGIHGEPGVRRGPLLPADEVVDEILEKLLADLPVEPGGEVAVLVNGLGATPLEEQFVLFRRIHEVLTEKGIRIVKVYVGEFATSMEMAGMSISLFRLDAELKRLLAKPAATPFWSQGQLAL